MHNWTGLDVLECELLHPDPLAPKKASPLADQLENEYTPLGLSVMFTRHRDESHMSIVTEL